MTPITIAGETLTEQDWPEGNEHFRIVRGVPVFNCTAFEVNLTWFPYNDQRKVIAAVARCHFLDKAAEAQTGLAMMTSIYNPCDGTFSPQPHREQLELEIARYLASAEKWARIGRAK